MAFEVFCATIIALAIGALLAFAGYRLFLIVLPIWGFVFGLGLGLQTIQALLGTSTFADATGLVVGFVVGLIFAVLSYLFYLAAVAIVAGGLGYGLTVAILTTFLPWGFLVWIIALVVGAALAIVVLRFNIQKYVIIIGTSLGGAYLIGAVLVSGVGGASIANALNVPLTTMLNNNPIIFILAIVVAIAGIAFQWQANRSWEIKSYNRYAEMSQTTSA